MEPLTKELVAFKWAQEGDNQLILVVNKEIGEGKGTHLVLIRMKTVFCLVGLILTVERGMVLIKEGDSLFFFSSCSHKPFSSFECTDFLEGYMTPQDFAERVVQKALYADISYRLMVGDLSSNSIVYVSKSDKAEQDVVIQPVPFGVHTLSTEGGLDSVEYAKDTRLRELFTGMIAELENNLIPPTLELIAEKYRLDVERVNDGRYTTRGTMVLVVQRAEGGKVNLIDMSKMDWTDAWINFKYDFKIE